MSQEIVKLTCEKCKADYEREKVPEEYMGMVHFRLKFRFCDVCFRERVNMALQNLPEVLRALANSASEDQMKP